MELEKIKHNSIDLVITDPPYYHNTSRSGGGNTKLANSGMYSKNSKMLKELSNFTPDLCVDMLNKLDKLMKLFNGYFFCNDRLIGTYCHWADTHKYLVNVLTWNKPLSILNRMRYSTNCEYIVRIHTASGTALNQLDLKQHPEYKQYYSKYQYYPQIKGKDKLHPCQKPEELIKGYILLDSKENDLILDPFMGSGTTGKVSKELNRNFIGIERDAKYFEFASERISDTYNKFN